MWGYDPSGTAGDIFADGFESGDITVWSSSRGASLNFEADDYRDQAICKLCVVSKGSLVDSKSLKVKIPNKKPHYLIDNSPASESRYRARFHIKLGKSLKMNSLNKFKLFVGKMGTKTPFQLEVRRKGTKFQIRAFIKTDGAKTFKTKWTPLPKKATVVEIDWKAAETTTSNDGYIKLYINDALKREKLGLNNDTLAVDEVRLGIVARIKAAYNISGSFKLDAFDSNQFFYIGP